MAISSTGIGSGLDVSSIISQLTALEKQPLKSLQTRATNLQTQLSALGQIQSQVSAMATAASAMGSVLTWKGATATSSNTAAVGVTASTGAAATSFNVEVSQLAKAQVLALPTATGAPALPDVDAQFGSGTLTIQVGSKSTAVTIGAGQGSLSNIAKKINEATAGVTATVLRDGSGKENILLRAADTGLTSAFTVSVVDSDGSSSDNVGLSRLSYPAPAPVPTTFSLPTGGLADVATPIGTGSISIQVGSGTPVVVAIPDDVPGTSGSLADIAAKINASGAGVTATVTADGSGKENISITPNAPNASSSLTITATDDGTHAGTSLSRLDTSLPGDTGGTPMLLTQAAQNAVAKISGVTVTSPKNTLTEVVPGVTLTLSQVTTTPAEVVIAKDTGAITKAIGDFVTAYNALNTSLTDATKYDAATKTAGPLQGDSAANGLLSALRRLMGSTTATGSSYSRLADVGITAALGGGLSVKSSKLTEAMGDLDNLQKLFTAFNGTDGTNGFGLRIKDFANGLLAATGAVTNKSGAIQKQITANAADQDKVNNRASLMEARLKKQYTALDAKMASLTALNSYVAQQVTAWNKSTS